MRKNGTLKSDEVAAFAGISHLNISRTYSGSCETLQTCVVTKRTHLVDTMAVHSAYLGRKEVRLCNLTTFTH
jgi:hypothetical protein